MDSSVSSFMKKLSRYESEISSILGMLVVAALAVFIFLFVKRFMPKPNILPIAENTQDANEDLMKASQNMTKYTVKSGQGLSQIASEVYQDGSLWTKIAEANQLKAPYILNAGQVLEIPKVDASTAVSSETKPAEPVKEEAPVVLTKEEPAAPTTPAPTPEVNTLVQTAGTAGTYEVKKGDHLWKIAVEQYGSGYEWVKIYEANKSVIGNDPNIVFVGVKLVLPTK